MVKKTKFTKNGIDELPNNKPVMYRIKTASGNANYIGIAKRGRVNDRLNEHLGNIPGATVEIQQFSSISEARQKEKNAIKRNQPKYNTQDK